LLVGLGRRFLGARRAPGGDASGGQTGLAHDELQNEPDADNQQNGSDSFHDPSPLRANEIPTTDNRQPINVSYRGREPTFSVVGFSFSIPRRRAMRGGLVPLLHVV
jgi:hypothetical protein